MTVERFQDQTGPATLSIFFAPPSSANPSSASASSSPAATSSTSGDKAPSDHTPWERVESIDMKHRKEREILGDLIRVARAKELEATEEEEVELRELETQRVKSERDREGVRVYNEKIRKERELLEQARGELA